MASVTVSWNTRPLDSAVTSWKKKALTDPSRHLRGAIRKRISIQGRPISRRSVPGEAPRRETGDLIRSWQYTVNAPAGYAIVYSNADYAYTLEVGGQGTWGFVLPRPHIRRTLLAEEAALVILLTQPLP